MLWGLGLCLAVAAPAPGLAQERAEEEAAGSRAKAWAALTPEEQESYGAAERAREAHRAKRPAGRRAGRADGGFLIPGETCGEAIGAHVPLPTTENDSTVGHVDDYTYGTACDGFNASSGVGPDLAYKIVTMITCDLLVELDPVANDLALWVVTDCDDPIGGCVGGDDSGGSGTVEEVAFTALAGTEYFILVDGFGGAADDFTLTISDTTQTGCSVWPVELQRFTVE